MGKKKTKGLLFLLKYYNVLVWKSRFTLVLNAAKNINHIKKCFRQKLFIIEFPTKKTQGTHISIYLRSGALEDPKDLPFLRYNAQEWEYILTLGLNTAKDIDYIEKWFKQKLHRIKFPKENPVEAYLYVPQE